jgi:hypothetical protein
MILNLTPHGPYLIGAGEYFTELRQPESEAGHRSPSGADV